jgi:hypothetical protein
LEKIKRDALGVRDGGLNGVGVADDDDGSISVLCRDYFEGLPHTKLHFNKRLAVRKTKRAWCALDRSPFGSTTK